MIRPVNGYILIEPLQHESFISSQKDSFEEIGKVLELDEGIISTPHIAYSSSNEMALHENPIKKGCKVFFDSWLAGKYPTGEGDKYFWLVHIEDIKAVETT